MTNMLEKQQKNNNLFTFSEEICLITFYYNKRFSDPSSSFKDHIKNICKTYIFLKSQLRN